MNQGKILELRLADARNCFIPTPDIDAVIQRNVSSSASSSVDVLQRRLGWKSGTVAHPRPFGFPPPLCRPQTTSFRSPGRGTRSGRDGDRAWGWGWLGDSLPSPFPHTVATTNGPSVHPVGGRGRAVVRGRALLTQSAYCRRPASPAESGTPQRMPTQCASLRPLHQGQCQPHPVIHVVQVRV